MPANLFALLGFPYFATIFRFTVGRVLTRHVGLKPDLRDTDDLSSIMESSITCLFNTLLRKS